MGAKSAKTTQRTFDPERTRSIIDQLQGMSSQIGQAPLRQSQLESFASSPVQQSSLQAQLDAIGIGRDRAQQQIQQTARSQATSRGLFSSRGAIEEEAAGLAQLPLQEALQRAQVLQQSDQQQMQARQQQMQALGMLSEQDLQRLQLQLQSLGQAGSLSGMTLTSSRGGSPGLGGLIGGLAGAAIGGPVGGSLGTKMGGGL